MAVVLVTVFLEPFLAQALIDSVTKPSNKCLKKSMLDTKSLSMSMVIVVEEWQLYYSRNSLATLTLAYYQLI